MHRTMPAYYTRAGARAAPANQPTQAADNTAAGTAQGPAATQADPDPTITGSTDRSYVTGHPEDEMANFATSLRDQKILMLRAEFNSAHKAVDEKNAEIDKLISYIEQAKKDDVPKELVHSYSIRLDHLLSQGNSELETFIKK